MINAILGTKQKMGQTFVKDTRVPVTWIKAGPCVVTQIKRQDPDGYWAVQLGFGEKKFKKTTKPLQGHLKAAYKDKKAARFLREIRFEKESDLKVGDTVSVSDVFKKGDLVAVSGISKGKGFAGVIKRWGFAGGPRTHGQSDRERAPGSIGQGTDPGRVWKGKKMAGNMGRQKTTVKNLIIVEVDAEKEKICVSGPVPGSTGSLLTIRKIASGQLDELVEETPDPEFQQPEVSEEEDKASEGKPEPKKEEFKAE